MISGAIYASADTEALSQREFLTEGMLCAVAADKAGAEYGVKYDLLQTISVVESGRFDKLHNQYVSWPWTVNDNGKGYYYSTKEEAVAAVMKFIGSQSPCHFAISGKAFHFIADALYSSKAFVDRRLNKDAFLDNFTISQFEKNWDNAMYRYYYAKIWKLI